MEINDIYRNCGNSADVFPGYLRNLDFYQRTLVYIFACCIIVYTYMVHPALDAENNYVPLQPSYMYALPRADQPLIFERI